jgi:hypothetical protein
LAHEKVRDYLNNARGKLGIFAGLTKWQVGGMDRRQNKKKFFLNNVFESSKLINHKLVSICQLRFKIFHPTLTPTDVDFSFFVTNFGFLPKLLR